MSFISSSGGFSNPMTTRGDLIRGGASGAAERVAAVTADTFVGGDGTDVTTRTTTQVRSSLFVTTNDLSSSTGWTTVDGTGTASITSGVLRLSHTAGTAVRDGVSGYNGPSAYRSLGAIADFDACIRIASMSAVVSSYCYIEIADASSAGNRFSTSAVQTGDVYFANNATATNISSAAGRFASFTGQEWLRISVRGGYITSYTGVGSGGVRPTSWTPIGAVAQADLRAWSHVAGSMAVVSTASTSTIDLDDLIIVDRSLGL